MQMHGNTLVSAALVAASALGAPPAVAQQRPAPPPGRVAVVVAVVDQPIFGQGTVILRRGGALGPSVIVMSREAATPEHLAAAAATLAAILERDGDAGAGEGLFRIADSVVGPAAELAAARHALAGVTSASLDTVRGVGPARTSRIYLPDRTARAALRAGGKLTLQRRPR
ncbi:MAG: hypothetical protein ACYCVL_10350 [Gemmatimonadaceae bacterium]